MEAAAATGLRPFAAPLGAATRAGAGWRCAPGQRRLGRGARVAARLDGGVGKGVPTTNYVVPLDKATGMTRPLVEILRDLNKRVPDKIIDPDTNTVPWSETSARLEGYLSNFSSVPLSGFGRYKWKYHANRMLSFYAPGWCGEVRDVIYSNSGTVTVVYRVILKGTDGEAFRDATGTAKVHEGRNDDAVAAAEEAAFSKACARFGFGLYLYHQDEIP
uniref:DNA repair RAD52-like protein 2, chloroplastic n=1 Tax=Aegilops tauschii TaxID=37682 RepID=M8C0E1_AEGTA